MKLTHKTLLTWLALQASLTLSATAQSSSTQRISWLYDQPDLQVSINPGGDYLKRIDQSKPGWSVFATSQNVFQADTSFSVQPKSGYVVTGLNSLNNAVDDTTWLDIDYAIYFNFGRNVAIIFENGVYKHHVTPIARTGNYTIERTGSTVSYLHNSQVLYTSNTASTEPLFVETAFHSAGGELDEFSIASPRVCEVEYPNFWTDTNFSGSAWGILKTGGLPHPLLKYSDILTPRPYYQAYSAAHASGNGGNHNVLVENSLNSGDNRFLKLGWSDNHPSGQGLSAQDFTAQGDPIVSTFGSTSASERGTVMWLEVPAGALFTIETLEKLNNQERVTFICSGNHGFSQDIEVLEQGDQGVAPTLTAVPSYGGGDNGRRIVFDGALAENVGARQLEKKSGSSGAESEETQEAKAAVKKQGKLFGSVSIVNSAEKFVLIKRRAGTTAPGIGSALKTKTARLMVSPERQGGFFVADIVRGEPSNGQRVYAADVSDEQQDMIEKLRVLKASEAVPLPALAIP